MHLTLNLGLELVARNFKVIVFLYPEPEFSGGAEVSRKSQRGFSRYIAPTLHDLCDAVRGDMQFVGEFVQTHAERLEKFLEQDFTRTYRRQLFLPASSFGLWCWSIDFDGAITHR